MARVSLGQKFRLLIWKNSIIAFNNKRQLIFELLLPALFTTILILVRYMVVPKSGSGIIYQAQPLSNLVPLLNSLSLPVGNNFESSTLPERRIPYSPKNKYLSQIMENAAISLHLETEALSNAKALEKELETHSYIAGVEFDDSLSELQSFPAELSFALRFPFELRTAGSNAGKSWETYRLYPTIQGNFPRNYNESDGGIPCGYLREGFLPLQNAISRAFITIATGKADVPQVALRRYPYPAFIYDPLLMGLKRTLPLVLVLSFIYPCSCIVRHIADEKEKQLKEIMKIMGLPSYMHWTAWFFRGLTTMYLACILMIIILQVHWWNNVAILTYANWSVILVFMFTYTIASVTFCFMVAVFFSKASTAAAATGLIWFMAHLPYMLMMHSYGNLSRRSKMAWCLICNTALAFGMDIIVGYEGTGEGVQWNNISKAVNVDDSLTVKDVMIMMLASSAIYMIICLYVEQVFPGKFGWGQKWSFPFKRKFWFGEKGRASRFEFIVRRSRINDDVVGPQPENKFTELQIKNLGKRFGRKWAVRNLNMNLYENEITVLLGHNGAGKTTTISMLTGLYPPTAGTAIIGGFDIIQNLDEARSSMGICPQYNILFQDLTVAQHIEFFCTLRGVEKHEIQTEIDKYLHIIDIELKANTRVSKLSLGMKRKLSVCCALCGDTKVVLCDEPSSGMDPAARRLLWNLLQAEKIGRTVLLTTHFMDEADILGDRVAIMRSGELQCFGTSLFLKKRFGSGYRLTCVKREDCDVEVVTELLRQYIPYIMPASDLGSELSYRLPYKYSARFEEMLQVLENNSEKIGLDGFGISITTMEEVFMKIGAEPERRELHRLDARHYVDEDDAQSMISNRSFRRHFRRQKYTNIFCNQFRSMFFKKMLYTWRKKMLFIIQNLIAVYFVVSSILVVHSIIWEILPPLKIDITHYKSGVTLLEETPVARNDEMLHRIAGEYEKIASSFGPQYKFQSTKGERFENYLLRLGEKKQIEINKNYIAGATVDKEKITAWLNNQALHNAPLTVNLVYNAIAKAYIGPTASIGITNKPLKRSSASRYDSMEFGESLGGQLAMNICFCMCFISSMYIIFLVKENISKAKLLQFVSGVRVWVFWLTHLIWDMLSYSISGLVLVCTLACFKEKYYSDFQDLLYVLVLIIVFGLSALPLSYLLAIGFREPATAFAKVSTYNIFLGMALFISVMLMSIPLFDTKDVADRLMWFFMISPHFCLAIGINELYVNTAAREMCGSRTSKLLSKNAICEKVPQCCKPIRPFGWERPGILSEIIYMLIVGFICFFILLVRDYNWIPFKALKWKKRKQKSINDFDSNIDSDVAEEKARIARMNQSEILAQSLVIDRLTKYYGDFLAVKEISLSVKSKECFGLLGINGAGKTTTFKMLTGDRTISGGRVFVRGYSVASDMRSVCREIGYCPQYDAFFENLTGRENLKIFSLLKGVPRPQIKYLSEELAHAFGFEKFMDTKVHKYSGGHKRKLSTALAVVGNPSVIYLDEPTSGMDPGARRHLWDVVCVLRDSGKAIVLTSHSMEECEALCTRLAIMVNGEFKCIGSIQHLKNKFSKGFILKIKVQSTKDFSEFTSDDKSSGSESFKNATSEIMDSPESEVRMDRISVENVVQSTTLIRQAYANEVISFVEEHFPSARLLDIYQGLLTFSIPLTDVKWSEIFGIMERNLENLNIEDYNITQTTLEEIFLDFARNQIDMRDYSGTGSCCKKRQI